MAAENRLSVDQLAALAPGDSVTIESAADHGRARHATGTVVRAAGPDILVKVTTRYGAYQERYRRRDGVRVGGLTRAELVSPESAGPAVAEARRRFQPVDTAYREWARNRADVNKLRQLGEVISKYLRSDADASAQAVDSPVT
ncbi:hypothetical protein [Geodermatophilus sp. CPCC 205506]|uniref:hypothetical protein n=1 Tax=Geodermatophilus sp. CPCC 205506 TaxID=2936596 RepID=UPI003EE9DB7C